MKQVYSSSICARHGLIQCKLLHRVHYTEARLAKMFDHIWPACDTCHQSPANVVRMYWLCASLQSSWAQVFDTLSETAGGTVSPDVLGASGV